MGVSPHAWGAEYFTHSSSSSRGLAHTRGEQRHTGAVSALEPSMASINEHKNSIYFRESSA